MNRHGTRFIAWLLTMVMLLALLPAAFAADDRPQASDYRTGEPIELWGEVDSSRLNYRTEKQTNKNNVICQLNRENRVFVLEKGHDADYVSWYRIRVWETEGWVQAKFIQLMTPQESADYADKGAGYGPDPRDPEDQGTTEETPEIVLPTDSVTELAPVPGTTPAPGENDLAALKQNQMNAFEHLGLVDMANTTYVGVTSVSALQSAHNYAADTDETRVYSMLGAASLHVKFSEDTLVENTYDYIYIYNRSNVLVGSYTGSQLAGKVIVVPGNTVKIRLLTDSSVNQYGYTVSKVVPYMQQSPTVTSAVWQSAGGFKLTWTEVTGSSGYSVYRYDRMTMETKYLASCKNETYTDTTAAESGTYFYIIRPYLRLHDTAYTGLYSTPYLAYRPMKTTAVISSVKAEGAALRVTWKQVPFATGYIIYRALKSDNVFERIGAVKEDDVMSYLDPTCAANVTYLYKVCAYKKVGDDTSYGTMSAAKEGIVTSASWNISSITALSSTSVKLVWKAIPGMKGYSVYRSTAANGTFSYVKSVSAITYTDTGLTAGANYFYKIRPYNKSVSPTVLGEYSNVASICVFKVTAKTDNASQITLSWNKVAGMSGYSIYQSTTKDGGYKYVQSVKSNVTSLQITVDKPNERYYFRVRPYKRVEGVAITSEYSSPVVAVAMDGPEIQSIETLSATSLKITWRAAYGAKSYRVYRLVNGAFVYLATTNTESYTAKNLNTNTAEYFKVLPALTVDGANYYGPYSLSVRGMPLVTPVLKSVTNNGKGLIRISFDAVPKANGYYIYRATTQNGPFEVLDYVTTADVYYDDTAAVGTTYYYQIREYQVKSADIFLSAPSNVLSAKISSAKPLVTSISITQSLSCINLSDEDKTCQLTAKVLPMGAVQDVKWSSSDTAVMTVNSYGIVTAVSAGKAVITATAKDGSGVAATVTLYASDLTITGSRTLYGGQRVQYSAKKAGVNKAVNWASSDTSLVTITSGGAIIASEVTTETKVTVTISDKAMPGIQTSVVFVIKPASELFSFTSTSGKITITGYTGDLARLSIPESINGQPVSGIAAGVFTGNTDIKILRLPSGITTIPTEAFMNCVNLKTVEMSNNVTVIGARAFKGCALLSTITPY